jgi:hypothetical protein
VKFFIKVLEELGSGDIDIPVTKRLEKSIAYLLKRLCQLFDLEVSKIKLFFNIR